MPSLAMEWTYEEVYHTIEFHCRRFWRMYGGSWHEWLSEGNYIFVIAYNSYDESRKASFNSYLYSLLSRRLYEKVRGKVKRYKGIERGHDKHVFYGKVPTVPTKPTFMEQMRMDLSDDAYDIVRLIVTSPADLKLVMLGRAEEERGVMCIRNSVKELLMDIGWSVDKIRESFAEIKEALC